MTETINFNPFAATVALFEEEGVCRIVGSWKVERELMDVELDDANFLLLPVNIPIGYCLVGGIRAAFNHNQGHVGHDDYHQPMFGSSEYWRALSFAAAHLPLEDKRNLWEHQGFYAPFSEAAFDEKVVAASLAEGVLIDWNDRIVGNHQNQEKDSRVLDFLRSLIPLWDQAQVPVS